MNRSSSGRAAGARVSGVTAGRSRGERVQMDVCKIRPGIYQYTALDDCSRYKVLRLYDRASASSTLEFLNHVVEESPFAIPTHPDRPWPRVLCRSRSTAPHGLGHQIPAHCTTIAASQRQGRAHPSCRSGGILGHSRFTGSRHRDEAGRVAASLELASAPYGAGRPFTHRPGLRTNRQDAPLGNRRGCIRPHTRAHQDRRLSPRQSSR